MSMPRLQVVVRDFAADPSGVKEIAEALRQELPHVTFDWGYVSLADVHHLDDGRTVVQDWSTRNHPWGGYGVTVKNDSLSRESISSLIARAERCGWDVVVDGVRLADYPSLVWRRLATWKPYPRYDTADASKIVR